MTDVKPAAEMSSTDLQAAFFFLVDYGPIFDGPFPEERAAELALELGRRAGVGSWQLFSAMQRAWGRNR